MKRLLLAAAAAVPFLAAEPAKAQGALETTQLLSWAKQAKDMVDQMTEAQRRYRQLVMTYNAIAHSTDLSGVANALGGVSRTYVPEASSTVQMLGSASRLFGTAGAMMEGDRLYQGLPQAGAFARTGQRWLEEMERRERATANAKALAEAGMMDAQERVVQLEAAKARLEAAQDGTEVAAVQGLIQVAQANMALHDQQMRAMQFALASEERVERQRAEQNMREHSETHMRSTEWALGALGSGGVGSGTATASAGAGW